MKKNMKKIILPLLLVLLLLSTACGAQNNIAQISSASPSDSYTPQSSPIVDEDIHQEPVEWPTESYNPVFGENITTKFELTATQQQLYDTYIKDFSFSTTIFADADPIDIAAVFIECGVNGLWEGEYNLFCFNGEPLTRADYKAENDADLATLDLRSRRDMASLVFPFINEGAFVDNSDGTGYIDTQTLDPGDIESGARIGMNINMTKVDGVWKVNQSGMVDYDYEDIVQPPAPDIDSSETDLPEAGSADTESTSTESADSESASAESAAAPSGSSE
ncbi:MAG: hypothetical protein LBL96_08580 [Clostridiales bacterium]|jgi:hypothetical protein|nr:hypothetical protein [Clostridiales bacterium]